MADKILKYALVITVGVVAFSLYTQYRVGKRKEEEKFSVKTEGQIIKR